MLHKATLSEGRFEARPFHVECSCGTQGDFETEVAARNWIEYVHFRRLSGICTSELPPPTPSASVPVSPPEPGAEVEEPIKSEVVNETVGDA